MKTIFLNEWQYYLKTRLFLLTSLVFMVVLAGVTGLGVYQNQLQYQQYQEAQQHVRNQWEQIDAMNPHSAAHYGSYAFKPTTALSSIDEGIYPITGQVLRLEGHVQNEVMYSEASQMQSVSKFGKLKSALILQYMIPLLLLFLAFSSVSGEKESGRLKLLLIQGGKPTQILMGKALGVWSYGLALLLAVILVQIVVNLNSLQSDGWLRILMLSLSYAAYYFVISALSVYFSARWQKPTAALSFMLALWILWSIFLPSIFNSSVEKMFPLPSRKEFQTAMKEDRAKGLDGHNPTGKRKDELEQKVLAEYKVGSVDELPINFDGILMQEDEEYGNQVWDKHFGKNNEILARQKSFLQIGGIINPFISLQNSSMGFAGSDYYHHQDFLQQAENYRRVLIKELNDKHAFGGSKTGEWSWEADNDFYKSIPDFAYQPASLGTKLDKYLLDLLLLGAWILFSLVLLNRASKKLKWI